MRFINCGILVLSMLSPASSLLAQSEPGPSTVAPVPNAEVLSEPWKPPVGAASKPLFPAPEVEELPIPGGHDPHVGADVGDPAMSAILEEPQGTWYSPRIWFGPAPWDSGIELGVNGSSGTSDSFSVRSGAYIKRESRFSRLDFDTNYNFTAGDGKSTQNNAKLDLTNDWLIDEKSPWTLFAQSNFFYDKFASFDVQTNANLGIGYRFVHTPELDLMTRVGAGAEREFGGENNDWVPESLVGAEYSQRVTKTQKFYGKIEYFPEWDQVGEYRVVSDLGWEIELVQPSNLSLKLSASDRYDSTPDGVNPHLLNYSVLLLLKL
jgi:putative salt-induced outer membrane protein YdiY